MQRKRARTGTATAALSSRRCARSSRRSDEAQREVLLEMADFWLRLGLVIGIEHVDEAKRLLDLSQEEACERAELLTDAEEWLAEAIR